MRLLNTKTLDLEWFMDDAIPKYIILSHRWQGNETTLQEFAVAKKANRSSWSPGTQKIMRFVEYAKASNEAYVWIDTICIDKTSSAELQEAINSMYRWYAQAEQCVVYLSDVVNETERAKVETKLKQSQWFTRGWTLQEFLAARQQIFVDQNWDKLGTRDDLLDVLEQITGIDRSYYGSQEAILQAPVATRMSWVSRRKTSRPEDMAYCMLGIFDISLTMLYGEGSKAFVRLQNKIIQEIDDDTIFIWTFDKEPESDGPTGVLAPHPSCFDICREHEIGRNDFFEREPYRMTTRGLEIEHWGQRKSQFQDHIAVPLNCTYDGKQVTLPLKSISETDEKSFRRKNSWKRVRTTEIVAYEQSQLLRPPSEEEAFQHEAMQISIQRHTPPPNQFMGSSMGSGGHKQSGFGRGQQFTAANSFGHNQMHTFGNPAPGRLGFELKEVMYKVYIV